MPVGGKYKRHQQRGVAWRGGSGIKRGGAASGGILPSRMRAQSARDALRRLPANAALRRIARSAAALAGGMQRQQTAAQAWRRQRNALASTAPRHPASVCVTVAAALAWRRGVPIGG